LADAQLTRLGELEQREKNGEHLPRLGVVGNQVAPSCVRAHGKHCANNRNRSINIERTRNDVMDVRAFCGTQNTIYRAE
jgi:hypothetical protein